MQVNKHVAVITDASNEVAIKIAQRLESDGMTVVRNYPDGCPKENEGSGKSYSYDNCSLETVKEFLAEVLKDYGDVDYLVHTDNVIHRGGIEDISEDDFRYYVQRNAKSAFITSKVFGEYLGSKNKGSVLYVSSLHDEKPTGCALSYSCGKGAVMMLSKEMALFYGRKGVRTNLIEMDSTASQIDLLDSTALPFNYDTQTKIPLHRVAKPEDFTGAVAFLLSDDAAYINGAEIRIDGGHLLYYIDR